MLIVLVLSPEVLRSVSEFSATIPIQRVVKLNQMDFFKALSSTNKVPFTSIRVAAEVSELDISKPQQIKPKLNGWILRFKYISLDFMSGNLGDLGLESRYMKYFVWTECNVKGVLSPDSAVQLSSTEHFTLSSLFWFYSPQLSCFGSLSPFSWHLFQL